MRHQYEPTPLDIRRPAAVEVIGDVAFTPDPFDAEALRSRPRASTSRSGIVRLDALGGRKKPHGRLAHKASVIYRETGVWVR